jgi:hypothetical protein
VSFAEDNIRHITDRASGSAAELRDSSEVPAGSLDWLAASLRSTHIGLGILAIAVGIGSGLGVVGFRWLIFAFTWIATGREQFGQQGRVASLHFPWLGSWFLLLVPPSEVCCMGRSSRASPPRRAVTVCLR